MTTTQTMDARLVQVRTRHVMLPADVCIPEGCHGLVLFAHGSGSSRKSPRNREVAATLNHAGIGTALMDLLTPDEEAIDAVTRGLRFDISLLATRLVEATDWFATQEDTRDLRIGYFGASTGAAAALVAAADRPAIVRAVVSRGGRPDLAGHALPLVTAPTLLLVGSRDIEVIRLNQRAYRTLKGIKELVLIAGASHLFTEPGTLEQVAEAARLWFAHYLD